MTTESLPELSLDFDSANGAAGITPELESRDRNPPLTVPATHRRGTLIDHKKSEDYREKQIANATRSRLVLDDAQR